jgi:adenylyltransferase/sulfurtransferase
MGSDVIGRLAAGLGHDELVRYSRHLLLPEVGADGQARLKAGRVLLIGAGGLGSPAALYLAAAGVGTLGVVDADLVELSNLQRQILHGTPEVGRAKVHSAAARIRDLNPHVQLETFELRLSAANALDVLRDFDVVVDGSDNFPTRYLVNDACVLLGKPDVYGAVYRFEGQASVFATAGGPCYRCLYPEPPPPGLVPSCAEGGVLGVLPGIIGTIQALEAIKLLLGVGDTLAGRLLVLDGLKLRFRELALQKDPACPVCGPHPSVRQLIDYEAFCGVPAGASGADGAAEITPQELAARLRDQVAAGLEGTAAGLQLVDVREPFELELCRLEGATHIPLGELPRRLKELDPRREIVTICHHGHRSLRAREILKGAGFSRVRSLQGGLDAWAREVDPTMSRY